MEQFKYVVAVNQEGPFFIRLGEKAVPEGWAVPGIRGDRESCLTYIAATWTDMRPLSLQRKAAATQN